MKMIKDKKLLLRILSGLIAVVLWFAITYTEDPAISQNITNIKASFLGEAQLHERGLTLVNADELPGFSVSIRGNRSKVIAALDEISAHIDVSNIHDVGIHEIPVQYSYPQNSVTLTKAKTSTASVSVEKILSREVPIKIEADTSNDTSDRLIDFKSKTQHLIISGAQSVVEKIVYAKVIVNTSEVTVTGDMNYAYQLYDKDDIALDEKNIIKKSESTILLTGTVYKKAELPVRVVLDDELKDEYALKIKEQSIKKLTVGLGDTASADELYVVLDSSVAKEHSPVTAQIQIPEDIYCPTKDLDVDVEYELLPKTVNEIEVDVSPKNAPEGKEVTINPEKITVSAKCAKDDAVSDNITATIDASKLDEAEKTVTVNVTADDNIEIIGKYTVTAKLH